MGKRPLLPEKRLPSPNAACLRRLCQPPWTLASRKESPPPHRRNASPASIIPLKRQPLFGRGGLGEQALLSESVSRPPTPHVRGGSVSRRGLTQAARNRHHPTGGTTSASIKPLKRQPLFGRGGLGERRFSQKAASPPESPPEYLSLSQSFGNGSVDVDEVDDLGDGGERP